MRSFTFEQLSKDHANKILLAAVDSEGGVIANERGHPTAQQVTYYRGGGRGVSKVAGMLIAATDAQMGGVTIYQRHVVAESFTVRARALCMSTPHTHTTPLIQAPPIQSPSPIPPSLTPWVSEALPSQRGGCGSGTLLWGIDFQPHPLPHSPHLTPRPPPLS
jgi:hypothetical protein